MAVLINPRLRKQAHKKDLGNHVNIKKHQEAFRFSEIAGTSYKITKFMPNQI
jgi:hypothetical protein